jgi:hypothetical protein
MLDSRGSAPRLYRNSLVFLAVDRTRLTDLDQAVRYYLAWNSIVQESEGDEPPLNLDAHQRRQARNQRDNANTTVSARIPETYQWLLVPTQSKPQDAVQWQPFRLQGQENLAVRASRKLKNDELLVSKLAASRLRLELDNVPLWRGDHVPVKQLSEDFARYLYLPRLRNPQVLADAVHEGIALLSWQQDSFAYADSFDEAAKRYRGLCLPPQIPKGQGELSGILLRPEAAMKQFQAEQAAAATAIAAMPAPQLGKSGQPIPTEIETDHRKPAPPPKPKRFYGSVQLNPQRVGKDAGKIAEEIVQHLALQPGAIVEVTLEIQAQMPEGAPENIVRIVTENARTLKFTSQAFEEQ